MSKHRLGSDVDNTVGAFAALLLALIAALFVPATARAQLRGESVDASSGTGTAARAGGWYSGISPARSQIGIGGSSLPHVGAAAPDLSGNEPNTGYTLYGGYQVNRNFALEGAYSDVGKIDFRRDPDASGLGAISSRSSGLRLDAVGIVPLQSGFSLFGKLGLSYTKGNTSFSTGAAAAPPITLTDLNAPRSEWNSNYGLGANYDVSNNLGLRLQYERINNVGDLRTGEGNVGIWSLGVTKRY